MEKQTKKLIAYIPISMNEIIENYSKRVGVNKSALTKIALHKFIEAEIKDEDSKTTN